MYARGRKEGSAMQIGDLTARSSVPAKSIRYYESVGLLPSPARATNNYRQYRATDVERLRFIASARSLGFAPGEIAAILAARDGASRRRAASSGHRTLRPGVGHA